MRVHLIGVVAACGFMGGAACGDAGSPQLPTDQSSSIRRVGESVWLTSPDDERVVRVQGDPLQLLESVDVLGGPEHLVWVEDTLVVTLSRASRVALLREATVTYVDVPCGGTHGVIGWDGTAWITCANDDRLLELDVAAGDVVAVHALAGRPQAIARVGNDLVVALSRLGELVTLDTAGIVVATEVLESRPGFAARQLAGIAVVGGTPVVSYQRLDHDSDRSRAPEDGGYGSVIDGNPRIAPQLSGVCAGDYAVFDGGARVFSGPSAVAGHDNLLWVVHRYTDNVALLRCATGEPQWLATFRVGRGPRGVVLSDDGLTAYVDVGFDHAVARLHWDESETPALLEPSEELRRDLGVGVVFDADERRGRGLFNDGNNTHLTPSGVVTCATCHPPVGDDGLGWFFHTQGVAPKFRRTPAAWAAKNALAPFHWDGEFDGAAGLSRGTIVEIMEGDGLLVDTDAMAAWMQAWPPPPGLPAQGSALTEGAAVFESAGCAQCHSGEFFADGLAHSLLPASLDIDGRMVSVFTPTLRGVRARPPYFHDGRAPDLRTALTTYNPGDVHGLTSQLTSDQLESLLAYLETL